MPRNILQCGAFHRWLMAVLLVGSWTGLVHAHPGLDAAKAAYDNGDYAIALARLVEAERDPQLTDTELATLHWYRAICLHAQGRKNKATAEFDEVLRLQPLFDPSVADASPKVLAAFYKRAQAYQRDHGVTVVVPPRMDGAQLSVTLEGHPSEATSVTVFFRAMGQPSFKQASLPVANAVAEGLLSDVATWEEVGRAGALELVVEPRNSRGAAVGRMGNAKAPMIMAVTPEQVNKALETLRPPPEPVPVTPPVEPPPVAKVDPPPPSRSPWVGRVVLAAGVTLGAAGLAMLAGAVWMAAAGAGSYAGIWALPREVGQEASPLYRGLLVSWLGHSGLFLAGLVTSFLLGAVGLGTAAAGVVLR